nr:hypothetical protein [Deltaproteobacteria bacterium]
MKYSKKKIAVMGLVFLNFVIGGLIYLKTREINRNKSKLLPLPPGPPLRLSMQIKKRKKQLEEKFGEDFSYYLSPPFIITGDIRYEELKYLAENYVLKPAQIMWRNYFSSKPDRVLTIILLYGQKSYRKWSKSLFGHENVAYFGYHTRGNNTLIMDITTGSGTLIHELTHALIIFDFPEVSDWFNEGLASLHEACTVEMNTLKAMVNWRLPLLQKSIRKKKLRPLKDLMTKDDFYKNMKSRNYAQARYFIMFIQKQGYLKKIYHELVENWQRNSEKRLSDDKVVEKCFGKSL